MNTIILDVNGKFKMHGDGIYTLDNEFDALNIKITENDFRTPMDLTGYSAEMAYMDKEKIGDIVNISTKNAEKGEVEFTIDKNFTAVPGVKYCQILLTKGEEKKHFAVFSLEVRNGVFLESYEEAYKDKRFEKFLESLDKIDGIISNENAIGVEIEKLINKSEELGEGINRNKTRIEEVSNRVTATESNITNTNKRIDNLKIGGRNLLLNSNKTVGETATREFVQFADVAPIIDKYGLIEYTISFYIKSKDTSKSKSVQVYFQNGSGSKYDFSKHITVTEEFQRISVSCVPTIGDENLTQAMLSFYGGYDTGNIPIVKQVKFEKGNKATDWTEAPEDIQKQIDKNKNDIAVTNRNHTTLTSRVAVAESNIELSNSNHKALANRVSLAESEIKTNKSNIKDLYSLIGSGETGDSTEILENVKSNSEELRLLRRGYNTAEDRLLSDIEKVSRKSESTLSTFEDYNPAVRNTLGGTSPYFEINGECTENIIEFLSEWDNQGTYAFRMMSYDRIQPGSKYTLVLASVPDKLEKVNLGAYGVDRYLPDTEGIICKFTTPAAIHQLDTYVRIYCRSGESFTSEDLNKIKVMLIKGHIDYYPEYFEGVNWIGKSDSKLKLITNNKNLCPPIKIKNTDNATYSVDWNIVNLEPEKFGESLEGSVTTETITLKPNKTYTVSYAGSSDAIRMEVYNSVKTQKINNTFTTTTRDFGIKLKLYCNASQIGTRASFLIQIEENPRQSVFEKPIEENIEVNLGDKVGLKGVPAIKDRLTPTEIQFNTGYLEIESTGWKQAGEYEKCICFNNTKYKAPLLPVQKDGEMVSNKFDFIWGWGDYRHIHTNVDLGLCITIPRKLLSTPDVSGFEKWLKTNEVYIVYRLPKPIIVPLEERLVISSYYKYTSLKINDKSSSLSSMKYYIENSSQMSNFNKDTEDLKEENIILRRAVKDTVTSIINILGGDIDYYNGNNYNRNEEHSDIENLKSILTILEN